jgi:hypothetical protein
LLPRAFPGESFRFTTRVLHGGGSLAFTPLLLEAVPFGVGFPSLAFASFPRRGLLPFLDRKPIVFHPLQLCQREQDRGLS